MEAPIGGTGLTTLRAAANAGLAGARGGHLSLPRSCDPIHGHVSPSFQMVMQASARGAWLLT